MSWECPECKKIFRNKGQAHTCTAYPVNIHLDKADAKLVQLYSEIENKIQEFADFDIIADTSDIKFRKSAVFAGFKIQKKRIDVRFYLDHIDSDPPVVNFHDLSKNRIIHQVYISEKEQLTPRFYSLLLMAFDLIE